MKKLLMLCLACFSMVAVSWSQSSVLTIQGDKGRFYVEHTVVAKENWYSVGRLYNISPKEIAPFNGLTIDKPLDIGQQLKIPLTATNFSQTGTKASDERLVPLYHTIQEKEWMYHISTVYNKVPIENLEKWNHITRDQAKAGMQLIVGYLKVKSALSALSGAGSDKTVAQAPAAVKQEEVKPATTPVTNDPVNKEVKTGVVSKNQTPAVTISENRPADKPASVEPVNATRVNTYATSNSTGGYFSSDYTGNNKSVNGQAGIFKSTSGWEDGKYYALMNNVPVGTIVKVTNPGSSKAIYAKVLGQLPDMKESAGLTIRISNAAASELGSGEGKFPVEVKY